MGVIKMKFEGGKDLEKALMGLKTTTAKSVSRRVLKKSGQPLADRANANAPEDQGDLSKSYGVSTRLNASQKRKARGQDRDDVFVYVGTNNPAGLQQEFGNVLHPAQPHLRPAWDALLPSIFNSIRDGMAFEVEKTVQRQRKRSK